MINPKLSALYSLLNRTATTPSKTADACVRIADVIPIADVIIKDRSEIQSTSGPLFVRWAVRGNAAVEVESSHSHPQQILDDTFLLTVK